MSLSAQDYFRELERRFLAIADPDRAVPMKKYMRDQFDFLGIGSPDRRELVRKLIADHPLPQGQELQKLWELCWDQPFREYQYFVYESGLRVLRKLDDSFIPLFESFIPRKSWWDTIDFLAPKLIGRILLRYPEQIESYSEKWVHSPNFWFQRSAILFQLDYKRQTNVDLLFRNIRLCAGSKEFFVQKAAGWALRQYSKTDPVAVTAFIEAEELPKLTVREGMKAIKSKKMKDKR